MDIGRNRCLGKSNVNFTLIGDNMDEKLCFRLSILLTVADPGFPRGGAPTPRGGGRQHMILPNFPKNCMKLKEFGSGGRASLAPPFDPPLAQCE